MALFVLLHGSFHAAWNWHRVQDRAVTLDLQRKMLRETPCDRVVSLDAGHSPFFSQPDALTRALVHSLEFARKRENVVCP